MGAELLLGVCDNINEIKMKVEKLKSALKKLLVEMAKVSTDKGLLSYESEKELPEVGENIYLVDQEGNEEVAADGEYRTDEKMVIVVKDGKVEEIRAEEEKPAEEPVEMPVDEKLEVVEPVEPAPVDEKINSIPEPEKNPLEEKITALEARLAAIEARLAALEAEPAVDSAEETFKRVNSFKKTGDEKLDRLNAILTAKPKY